MKEINGKVYPMWNQFLDAEKEWIGGTLINIDMGLTAETKITGVILEKNGDKSEIFGFKGEDFDCTSDVRYVGIGHEKPNYKDFLCLSTQYSGYFLVKKHQ